MPVAKDVAKLLFKHYLLEIGFLDSRNAAAAVREFADAMRLRELELHDEVTYAKAELDFQRPHIQAQLADARKELRSGPEDLEREYLHNDLADLKRELETLKAAVRSAKTALAAYRRDKRLFFVEYINELLHGSTRAV